MLDPGPEISWAFQDNFRIIPMREWVVPGRDLDLSCCCFFLQSTDFGEKKLVWHCWTESQMHTVSNLSVQFWFPFGIINGLSHPVERTHWYVSMLARLPGWRTPPAGRRSSGGAGPSSWRGGWCRPCAAGETGPWACPRWRTQVPIRQANTNTFFCPADACTY